MKAGGIIAFVALVGLATIAGAVAIDRAQAGSNATIQGLRDQIDSLERDRAAMKAEKDRAVAQAREAEGRSLEAEAKAQAAKAKQAALKGENEALKAKLAQMQPLTPPTDPAALPATARALAEAFTVEGLQAIPEGPAVVFQEPVAQQALALVIDGKAYPRARDRAVLLEAQVVNLEAQVEQVEQALGHQEEATREAREATAKERAAREATEAELAKADQQRAAAEGIIAEKDKALRLESRKKWLWGGSGAALALLVLLL